VKNGAVPAAEVVCQLFWNSNRLWLACTERDDAANGIVRRDANGNPVAWNHFDAEASHAAAQLGKHLMASVTLHAVEPAAVYRHNRALQIVLAQIASNPFSDDSDTDEGNEETSSPRRK
jgi:hypothetical protein